MTILIDAILYPHYKTIEIALRQGRTLPNAPYADYLDVYFPIITQNTHVIHNYAPLGFLAGWHKNEPALTQLLALETFNPNVTDLTQSRSLTFILLSHFARGNSTEKTLFSRMLKKLLQHNNLDPDLGNALAHETPLQLLAIEGAEYLDWIKQLIQKGGGLQSDIRGANALTMSLQEAHYTLTDYLLTTPVGQKLLAIPRVDGAYPLEIACRYSTDLTQGTTLIQRLLANPRCSTVEQINTALFAALSNANTDCALSFMRMLFAKGANPNISSELGDRLLAIVVNKYYAAVEKGDAKLTHHYKEIILLLLTNNADIFFKVWHDSIDFIISVGKDILEIFSQHFKSKSDNDSLRRISSMRSTASQTEFAQLEAQDAYLTELYAIHDNDDVQKKQIALFMLIDKYLSDWTLPLPQDNASTLRRNTVLRDLTLIFQHGLLLTEKIFPLIVIFDKVGKSHQVYIPALFRQYFLDKITHFKLEQNNTADLANLFMACHKFSEHAQKITTENSAPFRQEANDMLQRILQLTLVSVQHVYASAQTDKARIIQNIFDKSLHWIEKINRSYLDEKSTLLILELKIAAAYFTDNKNTFDDLYAQITAKLPPTHILLRQYDYWHLTLLFKQIPPSPINSAFVTQLETALTQLTRKHSDIPAECLTTFHQKITTYQKTVAEPANNAASSSTAENSSNSSAVSLAGSQLLQAPVATATNTTATNSTATSNMSTQQKSNNNTTCKK